MFPSRISENPFPEFQPSFHSGLNGLDNGSLHHHHHDLLFQQVPVAASASDTVNSWAALNKPILTDQEMNRLIGDHCAPPFLGSGLPKRPRPVKKDRHSKIVTAQGPRDRRVRLSIGIAQKFFGLQDMLGFDKASKTLDWLLTKSKTAIEEVMQMHSGADALVNLQSSVSECENGDSEGKSSSLMNLKQSQNAAKESRANARARARERTRKKMCTKAENLPETSPNSTQNQSLPLSQLGATTERSSGSHICHISSIKGDIDENESIYHHILNNAVADKNINQESMKRKMKPSSIFGFQQNLIISNDAKLEDSCFPCTTGKWDIESSVTRSSMMYNMTNICSSKVLQIRGNSWDV